MAQVFVYLQFIFVYQVPFKMLIVFLVKRFIGITSKC